MLRRENVNDALGNIVQFVALQRIRVPALRDAAEHMAAARLKSALMQLDAMDELPCQPEGHPDILYNVEFVIDPHQSIHSMPTFVEGMAAVLDRVGIGILHNVTDVPFITSDNPVAYFDPRCSVEGMLPYTIDRSGGPVVLCFPIAPRLMLYGHSSMRDQFARHGLLHGDIAKKELVELMNQQTSRFAYRAVIADRPGFENLVQQFSHESPIVKSTIMRQGPRTHVEHRSVFGKGESKPKWEANRAGR